jgi:hypothetical protein
MACFTGKPKVALSFFKQAKRTSKTYGTTEDG